MNTLKDGKVGKTYRIVKIHGSGPLKRRIMDMGLTKRVEVFVRKSAPFGDPIQINVRNYELSMRRADAMNIEVEEVKAQWQLILP